MTNLITPKRFKVLIVGDAGVGKTTFVNRLLTGKYNKKYVPTLGATVTPLTFHTNMVQNDTAVIFDVWDVDTQYNFLGDGYFTGVDAAIIMIDKTRQSTYNNSKIWKSQLQNVCGPIPIIVCANKLDLHKEATLSSIVFFISCNSFDQLQLAKPFQHLARRLLDRPDLEFIMTGNTTNGFSSSKPQTTTETPIDDAVEFRPTAVEPPTDIAVEIRPTAVEPQTYWGSLMNYIGYN